MAKWLVGEEYAHKKAGFMNRTWDSFVPGPEVWKEVFRVLKPGGYALVFASTRTDDLMSMALRLAGFRKHPFIAWAFGSGFTKASNLSKAFDEQAGAVREVIGKSNRHNSHSRGSENSVGFQGGIPDITAPATDLAKQWDGWFYGLQSLKPAVEPILMFQKPHEGRMTDNVEQWGTGAINVDGCRVGDEVVSTHSRGKNAAFPKRPRETTAEESGRKADQREGLDHSERTGRWPANLILSPDEDVIAMFPKEGRSTKPSGTGGGFNGVGCFAIENKTPKKHFDNGGSAARFFKQVEHDPLDQDEFQRLFYCAKASKKDRDGGLDYAIADTYSEAAATPMRDQRQQVKRANNHPTVKPVDLMKYLCRLVTPKGGVVLDPFIGSGSTGKAAMLEGFRFIGIEREADYIEIARARIANAASPVKDEKQTEKNAESLTPDLFGEAA